MKTPWPVPSVVRRLGIVLEEGGGFVAPMWQVGRAVWRETQRLEVIQCNGLPEELELYAQPSRPARLEDVPDRRVISCPHSEHTSILWFRESGEWFAAFTIDGDWFAKQSGAVPCPRWKLTDCVVELVETEVGVMG